MGGGEVPNSRISAQFLVIGGHQRFPQLGDVWTIHVRSVAPSCLATECTAVTVVLRANSCLQFPVNNLFPCYCILMSDSCPCTIRVFLAVPSRSYVPSTALYNRVKLSVCHPSYIRCCERRARLYALPNSAHTRCCSSRGGWGSG